MVTGTNAVMGLNRDQIIQIGRLSCRVLVIGSLYSMRSLIAMAEIYE